ncbi:hypothetical protein Tco_0011295 [Tanacetum coccineum]
MADVMTMPMPMIMEDITSKASSLNIDLSSIDWNSICVPPGEDFGILRLRPSSRVAAAAGRCARPIPRSPR